MNKTELVSRVADQLGTTQKEASQALEAVSAAIMKALEQGEKVTIPGLAKFETKVRGERQVRNPRTGETFTKPETTVVKVSPARSLSKLFATE